MNFIFTLVILLIGVPFTLIVFSGSAKRVAAASRAVRPLMVLGSALATAGAVGFFGTALACLGGLNWMPSTTPLPIGPFECVVPTDAGDHVLAHSAGRIQVYDRHWRYETGWFVTARSGPYKITGMDSESLAVVANHTRTRWRFDWNGNILSQSSNDDYDSEPGLGKWQFVPPDMGALATK